MAKSGSQLNQLFNHSTLGGRTHKRLSDKENYGEPHYMKGSEESQ
jgi:hypothetical protein